jgi:hypothetical protein
MTYSTVRVVPAGVVLFDAHRRRLGEPAAAAFDAFSHTATPGVYSLAFGDGVLSVTPRPGSRLHDGQATRTLPSPIARATGPQPKQSSPSPWDTVRTPSVATLLSDPQGTQLYESCVAAVVAWDGRELVLVPDSSPRVESLAERFVQAHHPHHRAPIPPTHEALLLINAVTLAIPAGSRFPPAVRDELQRALDATAARASGMV